MARGRLGAPTSDSVRAPLRCGQGLGLAVATATRAYDRSSWPPARDVLPPGTVTFVFTDIEGSTRLVDQLGPAWDAVLGLHRRTLRRAFRRHHGVEMGTEGDSFFVAFGDAPSAVAAVVEGQLGLASAGWPDGVDVRVRIGAHSGQARVIGGDYVGMDVHRAARIGASAHGGQIVMSESTRALVERDLPGGVELRDLGRHWLKDLPAQEHLYQVLVPGLPVEFPPLRTVDRGRRQHPGRPDVVRRA